MNRVLQSRSVDEYHFIRGMDFPNDVSTNVYRIDDVEEIYWAFYSRRHGVDEEGKELQNEQPDEEEKDMIDSVQVIEYRIRKRGYHVLSDEDNPGLWIFCLSRAEVEDIAQFKDLDSFACLGSGCVHSSKLSSALGLVTNPTHTATSPSHPISSVGEINMQKFNANTKIGTRPAGIGQTHTLTDIYPKMLAAISQTMSHHLSQETGLLLIGLCRVLDVRTLGDHAHEYPESGLASARTAIVSCTVRWHSSGTLLFALSGDALPQLSTLAHVGLSRQSSSPLPLGASLLLSPSGLVGYFHGIENTPKGHPLYRARAEMKSSIASGLMSRGISMPAIPQWALVQVEADKNGRVSKGEAAPKPPHLKLWPAHLCLCKDLQTIKRSLGKWALPENDLTSTVDPLEEAQEWFSRKSARMEALEAKRRQDRAEVERTKEAADAKDGDAVSDFESQVDLDVTPRDVNGIYPTPPDGMPSAAHDSSLSNAPRSEGNADDVNGGIESDGMHQSYQEERKDDLFEGMDIDAFATNGLTEDDFNFFDEPNLRGVNEHDNAHATFSSDPFTFEEPVMPPTSTSPFDEHPSPAREAPDGAQQMLLLDAGNASENPEGFAIEVLNSGDFTATADSVLLKKEHQNSHETTSIEEGAANRSAPELESLLPKSPQPEKVSFDLIPFSSTSLGFDDKYASHGRYAFSLHDLPQNLLPSERVSHENHVPHFGVLEMGGSPVEDNMDIDDTYDESSAGSLDDSQVHEEDDDEDEDDDDEEEERNGEQSPEESHQHPIHEETRFSSAIPDLPATPLSSTSPAEDRAEVVEGIGTMVPPADLYSPRSTTLDKDDMRLRLEGDVSDSDVYRGKDQRFIHVAQMVAHQAVSGTDMLGVPTTSSPQVASPDMTGLYRRYEEVLACVSSEWGKVSKKCTLKGFVDLDDHDAISVSWDQQPPQQKPSRPSYPRRPSPVIGQAVLKLQAPYTCVQRTGTAIDIAVTALRFWEELSLAPSNGHKNVVAFCVCPLESVQDQILTFLKMMEGAYQSCNLGLHELGELEQGRGLFPAPMGKGGLEDSFQGLYLACEGVGRTLGRLNLRGGNTVIYMVNPFPNGQYLPTLCNAFLRLFDAYLASMKQKNFDEPNDLVLQIVPSDLMYSANSLPMPSPSDYRRLALEVYDRCGPNDNGQQKQTSPYFNLPSIRLAKAIPKTIDFRLTPENSALSLQSDNCLHIAYAWTTGEDWLTASWTDNLGVLSWNACYCLGEIEENPWPTISGIVNEIWETTLDMLQPHGGPWHLFISKSGTILKKELAIWQSAFEDGNNSSVRTSIRSSLFTLNLDPLLDFPIQSLEARGSDIAISSLATPDNTPQANAPSPDISGLASTTGGAIQVSTPPPNTAFGDHDGEARLIDIADETWGVAMKTSVEDLCIVSDHCSALACGYLVKRAGPRDEDGLVRMEVNVIHGQTPLKPLLKAVLGWYRNLGLLARVRGIADPVKGLVPYHVAATNKAHAAVTATMRYGDGDR